VSKHLSGKLYRSKRKSKQTRF